MENNSRLLSASEMLAISGGIEVIEVTGQAGPNIGGWFGGAGYAAFLGFSNAYESNGGQYAGLMGGLGVSATGGYSSNAGQAADNVNEGLKVCLVLCSDLTVKGLFSGDFTVSGSVGLGVFYGETSQVQ